MVDVDINELILKKLRNVRLKTITLPDGTIKIAYKSISFSHNEKPFRLTFFAKALFNFFERVNNTLILDPNYSILIKEGTCFWHTTNLSKWNSIDIIGKLNIGRLRCWTQLDSSLSSQSDELQQELKSLVEAAKFHSSELELIKQHALSTNTLISVKSGIESKGCASFPGVYRIHNIISRKTYVGISTRKIRERWQNHRGDLRKNKHKKRSMQKDWNTYGDETFRWIVQDNSRTFYYSMRGTDEVELFWMKAFEVEYNPLQVFTRGNIKSLQKYWNLPEREALSMFYGF